METEHINRLKEVEDLRTKLEKKVKKKPVTVAGPKRGRTMTDTTSAISSVMTKQSTKNAAEVEARFEIAEGEDYGYLAGAPRTFSVNPKVHSMTPTLKRLNIHDYDKKLHDDCNHKIADLKLTVKKSNKVVSRSIKTTDPSEIRRVTKLGMIRELFSI